MRRKEGGFSIIGLMVSMTLFLIIIVAIPAQPAIPHVRPAIPAEPASYRVYTNFIGNIILPNGRVKYAEQFLIKDLTTQNPSSEVVAKKITIRIYYANSQGDYVDTNFHKEPPGSGYIKRFENPLAELSEVIERPW